VISLQEVQRQKTGARALFGKRLKRALNLPQPRDGLVDIFAIIWNEGRLTDRAVGKQAHDLPGSRGAVSDAKRFVELEGLEPDFEHGNRC
jgi:hypothetical protein